MVHDPLLISCLQMHTCRHWPAQRGTPAAKTRTALLYKLSDMSTPQAWGWEAVSQYADLPQVERVNFRLFESFKKYLMPDDFEGRFSVERD